MPTITFTDVSFTWPDGTSCLAPFSLSLDAGTEAAAKMLSDAADARATR